MLVNPSQTSELKSLDPAACWRKPGDRGRRTMSAGCSSEQEEFQIHMGFQPSPCPSVSRLRNVSAGRKHAWSLPAYTHCCPATRLSCTYLGSSSFSAAWRKKKTKQTKKRELMFLSSGNLVRECPLASKKCQAGQIRKRSEGVRQRKVIPESLKCVFQLLGKQNKIDC